MNAKAPPLRRARPAVALVAGCLVAGVALAFPPAPHHTVQGLVRDELGRPLDAPGAEVLLESGGSLIVKTTVIPGMEPGANYRLAIPLDSGTTPDLFKPTALRPTVPFRMRVRVGNTTYLPLEMTGATSLWTRPADTSHVDLTLGIDSDGDGLPDAWEQALLQMAGGGGNLADIRPGDDTDGDGISNLNEYLAGTYAFDPADGFVLEIAAMSEGHPVLEFTAIRGRSYTIHGSDDMVAWAPVRFSLSTDAANGAPREVYLAAETRPIRALAGSFDGHETAWRFFKLEVR